MIKGIISRIFEFIKKVYLLLYNFMVGAQTKKFNKFYVHFVTIMLFILSPIYYYNLIVQLLTVEGAYIIDNFIYIILGFLLPAILACIVKVAMLLKW